MPKVAQALVPGWAECSSSGTTRAAIESPAAWCSTMASRSPSANQPAAAGDTQRGVDRLVPTSAASSSAAVILRPDPLRAGRGGLDQPGVRPGPRARNAFGIAARSRSGGLGDPSGSWGWSG